MEMEVDAGSNLNGDLFVCYITKKNGLKRTKIQVSDIGALTLERLRSSISQELESWEWADAGDKPQTFGIQSINHSLKKITKMIAYTHCPANVLFFMKSQCKF